MGTMTGRVDGQELGDELSVFGMMDVGPQCAGGFRNDRRGEQLLGGGAPAQDAGLDRQPPHRRSRAAARRPPARAIDAEPAADRRRRRSPQTCAARGGAQRRGRQHRFEPAGRHSGNAAAIRAAEPFRHAAGPAGGRLSGRLPQCPGPDPRDRALRRSYRRRRRSGVPAGGPQGFGVGCAQDRPTGTSLSPARPISRPASPRRRRRTSSTIGCSPFRSGPTTRAGPSPMWMGAARRPCASNLIWRSTTTPASRPRFSASAGIGELPPLVRADLLRGGRLVEVMPEWRFAKADLSIIHRGNQHMSRPVRLFKDFAVEMVPTMFSGPAGLRPSRAETFHEPEAVSRVLPVIGGLASGLSARRGDKACRFP